MRIFKCHFICDECNDNQFDDEMLTSGVSWCPCCDKECEPYLVDEFEDECIDDEETV